MSVDPHVDACLAAISSRTDALVAEAVQLSDEQWAAPTNCAPWRVRELVAHVTEGGEAFVACVRRGLAGSVDAPDGDARARRQAELAEADAGAVAAALQAVTIAFAQVYEGLDDGALSALCYHRRGNRPVRWYAVHRLSEVAFHAWDVDRSLGRDPVFPESVAVLILPTLLESNAARTYAAGLTPERGSGERFALAVGGDAAASWIVQVDPDQLVVQRGRADAGLTVTGSAADLALLVYGRRELPDLVASHAVRLDGDVELAGRFARVFPRP